MKNHHRFLFSLLLIGIAASAVGMDMAWVRMTGQYHCDATPLMADLNGDGAVEMVTVNRQGQVLWWAADGSALGAGQDGTAAQLGEGRWTSMPALWQDRLLFVSVEGRIAAFDKQFKPLWEHALGAETVWSRAIPVAVPGYADRLAIGDVSGRITCLNPDGALVWSRNLQQGPCRAPLQTFTQPDGRGFLLAACGDTLFCLDGDGQTVWTRTLQAPILSQPQLLTLPDRTLLVCGTGKGTLYALNLEGEVRWSAAVGGEIDSTIVFLPREGNTPLILCAGVWGNLYALSVDGKPVWQHRFHSKNRARPAVADINGDGKPEVLVATYRQELLAIDEHGYRVDQVRFDGGLNASPVVLRDPASGQDRVIVISTNLTAHALKPGPLKATFGTAGEAASGGVKVEAVAGDEPGIRVSNPAGALLRVHVATPLPNGAKRIDSFISARSLAEWRVDGAKAATMDVRVDAADGSPLFAVALATAPAAPALSSGGLSLTAVDAYAGLDGVPQPAVQLDALYRGETDQGALRVAWNEKEPMRARLSVQTPKRADGTAFAGTIRLFEAVPVGTMNGEEALDALNDLGDSGLVSLTPHQPALVWVQVSAKDTAPGEYTGKITGYPLLGEAPAVEIPLQISVPDLQMPADYPLTLCTWDYVPNQWFPERTEEVLNGMRAHGVNVFPRTTIPPAVLDAAGQCVIDWTVLDTELARMDAGDLLLLQIGHPPITWPADFPAEQKQEKEIAYLLALRDHLKAAGWDYSRYAFYPIDEPGLDLGKNSVPAFLDAAKLFRAADPSFRIYTDPVPSLSWADFEKIEPFVDVWCPNMRLVTGLVCQDPRMQRILASGKPVWSYECVSQVRSLSPLRYNRANAWRGWQFGLQGIGFWTFTTTQEDHWPAHAKRKEEYAMVYPGVLPVSSVRWEAARDGLEDTAALSLLKQALEAQRGNPAKQELVQKAETELRIAGIDVLEMADAAYVESRDYLAQGDRRIWHTATDAECFQMHRDTIARLTLALRK